MYKDGPPRRSSRRVRSAPGNQGFALGSSFACSISARRQAAKPALLGVFAFLLVVVGVARGAEADSGRVTLVQQAPPAGALIVNDNPGGLGQPAACADPNYTSSDLGQATDSASPDV